MSIPKFTLALKTIESFSDSTEVGNDEPYLLIIGVDFTHASALVIDTTRYGPFSLGRSETATTFSMPFGTPAAVYDILDTVPGVVRRPFWGLKSHMPTPIADINKMAFVMLMMENDDGDPQQIRNLVHGAAVKALNHLAGSPAVPPSGLKKIDVINAVINAVNKLRSSGALDGGLNDDDFVEVKHLIIDEQDFKLPLTGRRDLFHRVFSNPSGTEGMFRVIVEMAFS